MTNHSDDFFIFFKKKSLWGGVNLIFGEKVAVSEGTFGAKKNWILTVIIVNLEEAGTKRPFPSTARDAFEMVQLVGLRW